MRLRAKSEATDKDERLPASSDATSWPAVPSPDAVVGLLRAYQRLIDEATRDHGWLKRGTPGFAVEHVRRGLITLQRRYGAHAALSDHRAPADEIARERVNEFAAALPPASSRWRTVGLAAAIFILARLLLAVFDEAGDAATDPLADAVSRVSSLSPDNVGDAVDAILHADLLTIWVVAMMFGTAAYIVLRPLANGWSSSRMLRLGAASTASRWYAAERSQAARLRVSDHESQVFEPCRMRVPEGLPFDLVVKACIAAPLLIGAFAYWEAFLTGCCEGSPVGDAADGGYFAYVNMSRAGYDGALALVLGAGAAARVAWLAVQARARRSNAPTPRPLRCLSWRPSRVLPLPSS